MFLFSINVLVSKNTSSKTPTFDQEGGVAAKLFLCFAKCESYRFFVWAIWGGGEILVDDHLMVINWSK